MKKNLYQPGRLPAPSLRLRRLQGEVGTLQELRHPAQGPGGRHLRHVRSPVGGGLPPHPPPLARDSLL